MFLPEALWLTVHELLWVCSKAKAEGHPVDYIRVLIQSRQDDLSVAGRPFQKAVVLTAAEMESDPHVVHVGRWISPMRIELQSKGVAFWTVKHGARDVVAFRCPVKKGCEVPDVPDVGGAVRLRQAGVVDGNPACRRGWISSDALKPVAEFGLDTEGNVGQFPVMFSIGWRGK